MRNLVKQARKRGALWVRAWDVLRIVAAKDGPARFWTQAVHRSEVHQTTPYTSDDRYPDLFDLAAALLPEPQRVLSFGCSTGEELISLRRRFPSAEIVGAEINPRSRRLARRRIGDDRNATVVAPNQIQGPFELVFALAVFQREPHRVDELGMVDIRDHYPFGRFDSAVSRLVDLLRPGGLLCVMHAQYRVEDSAAGFQLEAIAEAPPLEPPLFGPDGLRIDAVGGSMFKKRLSSINNRPLAGSID
jgi:trans-aconitate methyltransferase